MTASVADSLSSPFCVMGMDMSPSDRNSDSSVFCTGGQATRATPDEGTSATPDKAGGCCAKPRAVCLCRWIVVVVVLVLVGLGIKYGRYHVFAKRFAVVEPGQVYRSGLVKPGPLDRVVEEHEIKTILTLLKFEADDPDQVAEKALAEREGIVILRIPMPGNGCGTFDQLEQAAAILADESHRPVLVHCAAGVQRTGASLSVWRMKYHGWSLEQALADMREHGYDEGDNPELREHLIAFSRERLATQPG